MRGYMLLFGDPNNPSDRKYATEIHQRMTTSPSEWRCCVTLPGRYTVYVDSPGGENSEILLHDERGAILGELYPARINEDCLTAAPLHSISREQSENMYRSKGRSLISGFWGHYVAAIYDEARSAGLVIRAPASSLPCFHTRVGTLNIFFSSPEDLVSLNLSPLTINWDSITAQMAGGDFLTSETAFNEITTVECGECIECTAECSVKRVYWDPHSFLRRRSPTGFAEAARMVRRVIDYSTNALSYPHRSVLVSLSGGLDSSIVLSALGRSPRRPTLTAVNYYDSGCGDERYYARAMARHAQCKLVECVRNAALDLRRFHDCNLTARPVLNFSAPDVESRNTALAHDRGATAIFNGELGDNIFGRRPTPGILVECLRHTGIRPKFASVALDYAMLTRQSIWRAIRLTFQERRDVANGRDFNALRTVQERYGITGAQTLTLASTAAQQHASAMGSRFLHPWLRRAREISPGSDKLLFGLVAVTSPLCHSPFASRADPPLISPFLTQPVIEALLQIPGYLHCHQAQDRAVARAAFSDSLPTEILNRGPGKGGPDLWAKGVIDSNIPFIREFLLDGILVKRGLLDRDKLEIVLSPTIVKSTAIVGDIFAKLYIEGWLAKASPFTVKQS